MAICGDTCSIEIGDGGLVTYGHRFSINTNAPEIDVRTFGSGDYGDWLACTKDGTITLNTYMPVDGVEVGDTGIQVICNVGSKPLTAAACTVTNVTCDVDAKSVVEWTYTFKLTNNITGW
jgi:hypothetical protein